MGFFKMQIEIVYNRSTGQPDAMGKSEAPAYDNNADGTH